VNWNSLARSPFEFSLILACRIATCVVSGLSDVCPLILCRDMQDNAFPLAQNSGILEFWGKIDPQKFFLTRSQKGMSLEQAASTYVLGGQRVWAVVAL
jgi:hypothetical protein